jgi:hypothetical protein
MMPVSAPSYSAIPLYLKRLKASYISSS